MKINRIKEINDTIERYEEWYPEGEWLDSHEDIIFNLINIVSELLIEVPVDESVERLDTDS